MSEELPQAERFTVTFVASAAAALREEVAASGVNKKSDIVNDAVQLYHEVKKSMRSGGALYLRESESGELIRVMLL